jgi:phosphoglycolate phosphatase-like HAD superfamily hydrolase
MHICFFDIDGTLVLTGGAGQTAFGRTLAADFGVADMNRDVVFAGRSDRAIAMELFRIHGISATAENWQTFCAGYVARLDETLPSHNGYVLPGVEGLLSALAARGDVALGLLTGNVLEAARRKLSHFGLWDHFAFGGFGDEHEVRSDIAAAALAAARSHLNGDSLGRFLVIGDTLHDIRCGQSIGARCVGVPTGSTPADVLRTAGPEVVVETLEDTDSIMALLDA